MTVPTATLFSDTVFSTYIVIVKSIDTDIETITSTFTITSGPETVTVAGISLSNIFPNFQWGLCPT
jgi:hypothetical protein